MEEAAEELELPASLQDEFACREYYGTVSHNVKAVFQRYLGWFDGNPGAPPPAPAGGGRPPLRGVHGRRRTPCSPARGSRSTEGDYRWVAEVVNHVVFAEPDNGEARELQADALEQLGYQAESGPWRAFYLTGALELRQGVETGQDARRRGRTSTCSPRSRAEMVLHVLGVRIDGPRADGRVIELDVVFTDVDESFALTVAHGALSHPRGAPRPRAGHRPRRPGSPSWPWWAGWSSLRTRWPPGRSRWTATPRVLDELVELLEAPPGRFPIVTP